MNKKLIERYYLGDCSDEEKGMIVNYFKNHPEELEEYFSESEWNLFPESNDLDPAITERMLEAIRENIRAKASRRKVFKRMAAAATLFILIGFAWLQLKVEKKIIPENKLVATTTLVNKTNETNAVEKINLPDGSVVTLFPKSTILYLPSFEGDSRKVFLSGEANFDVFHDSTRPFSVVSREISTTALGTYFKVIAAPETGDITVKLYRGSVVIRNADKIQSVLNMDYYLKPGEAFFYNSVRKISGISKMEKKIKNKNRKSIELKEIPELSRELNNWYMFNNQSLAMVFESLKMIYDVKIVYNKSEIREMSFIGRVERVDSIENLLRDIAQLNGLRVIKNGKTFTITK
ncbi:MAG: FecR domain-containing protein [Bacteroidetes bacterium]|nr:FecR domain-containing protein [Bacteroidota bacterium]